MKTTVTHLANACSDHVPFLTQFSSFDEQGIKYFKFLNFWTDHEKFLNIVKDIWEEESHGNPMRSLHQKLKKTASKLSVWSRETYGDTHEEAKKLELEINNLEMLMI